RLLNKHYAMRIQPPWSARGRRPAHSPLLDLGFRNEGSFWALSARFGQLDHRRRTDGDARGDVAFGIHQDRRARAGDAEDAARSKTLVEEHGRAKAARPVGFDRAGGHEDEPRTLGFHPRFDAFTRSTSAGRSRSRGSRTAAWSPCRGTRRAPSPGPARRGSW